MRGTSRLVVSGLALAALTIAGCKSTSADHSEAAGFGQSAAEKELNTLYGAPRKPDYGKTWEHDDESGESCQKPHVNSTRVKVTPGMASLLPRLSVVEDEPEDSDKIDNYIWVVTKEGDLMVGEEVKMYRRVDDKGPWVEKSKRKAAEAAAGVKFDSDSGEVKTDKETGQTKPKKAKLGHPSLTNAQPARIAGELYYDKVTKQYTINNASGRYSRHLDRKEKQLENVAALFAKAGMKVTPDYDWRVPLTTVVHVKGDCPR